MVSPLLPVGPSVFLKSPTFGAKRPAGPVEGRTAKVYVAALPASPPMGPSVHAAGRIEAPPSVRKKGPEKMSYSSQAYKEYADSQFIQNYFKIRNDIQDHKPFTVPGIDVRVTRIEDLGEGHNSKAYKCQVSGDVNGVCVLKLLKADEKITRDGYKEDVRELVIKTANQLKQYAQFKRDDVMQHHVPQHFNFDPHLEAANALLDDDGDFRTYVKEKMECPALLVSFFPHKCPRFPDLPNPLHPLWVQAKRLREYLEKNCARLGVADFRCSNIFLPVEAASFDAEKKILLGDLYEFSVGPGELPGEVAALRTEQLATFGSAECWPHLSSSV
ncbi:MAG TPA: hypothetical protein VLF94_03815 [Chlamydiales bacterium]|nr:hypothetical protein [Chlamydiales bacterium]